MKTILLASLFTQLIFQFSFAIADDKPLSGQAKIDSLLAELPKAKGDTNHVNLLKSISFTYSGSNPDKGIEYGEKGLALSIELDWKDGVASSYNSIGTNYQYQSNYSKAMEYFSKALEINEELGDKKGVATNSLNIGNIYQIQSDYAIALEYYDKALRLNEVLGDERGIAIIFLNMGNIYLYQSNYSKAMDYYDKSLKINEELGNKGGVAASLGNIGIVYYKQMNYQKSLQYFGKALKISEELGDKYGIATNLGNVGNTYNEQSNYPKALEYYNKALNFNEEMGDNHGAAVNLGNIGKVYLVLSQDVVSLNPNELNNYISLNNEINLNKSIEYSLESIRIFEEIGELDFRSLILENLANAYKAKGDMTKAYEALEEHHKLKDSVFNQENAEKIAALEKAREDDLKQKEIEKQKIQIAEQEKREQLILYFSIGFIIVMAIVMFIIYRLLKRSDKLLYNVLPVIGRL
ncbi:MAG: tetratricopeptide repeat protein [Chlorobiota bacterium]